MQFNFIGWARYFSDKVSVTSYMESWAGWVSLKLIKGCMPFNANIVEVIFFPPSWNRSIFIITSFACWSTKSNLGSLPSRHFWPRLEHPELGIWWIRYVDIYAYSAKEYDGFCNWIDIEISLWFPPSLSFLTMVITQARSNSGDIEFYGILLVWNLGLERFWVLTL